MQPVEASTVFPLGLEETWDFIFDGQGQRATLAENVVSLEDLLSVADNQLH